MVRLFIILLSVFAFSNVAVAAGADASKKPTTEVTKDAAAEEAVKGGVDDKTEENKTK